MDLTISGANTVTNADNSFTYSFGRPLSFRRQKVALRSYQGRQDWFSISAVLQNNQIGWLRNDGTTRSLTIPDGLFDINSLNGLLQAALVADKFFVITTMAVTFLSFGFNDASQSTVVVAQPVPTTNTFTDPVTGAASTFTVPTGATFPLNGQTPSLIVNPALGLILGLVPASYPPSFMLTTYMFKAPFAPQLSPIRTVDLCLDIVATDSSVTNNPNSVYMIRPDYSSGGSIAIDIQPNTLAWCRIADGNVQRLKFSLRDQNSNIVLQRSRDWVLRLTIEPIDNEPAL
jgi:hypothetical protein